MEEIDDTCWLSPLFSRAAVSVDARRWLLNKSPLRATEALRISVAAPMLMQFTMKHLALEDGSSPAPGLRDVLIMVKDGDIPLFAGFEALPDPSGYIMSNVSEDAPGLPETNVSRVALVRNSNYGMVLLSFLWKKSGAVIIKAHSIAQYRSGAPLLVSLHARYLAPTEAKALYNAGQDNIDEYLPQFLAATLLKISPKMAKYCDVVAYDSRAQLPCFFCFARGEVTCECPSPLRRRYSTKKEQATLSCLPSVQDSGTMFISFLKNIPSLPTKALFTMATRAAQIHVVLESQSRVSPVIQEILLTNELMRFDSFSSLRTSSIHSGMTIDISDPIQTIDLSETMIEDGNPARIEYSGADLVTDTSSREETEPKIFQCELCGAVFRGKKYNLKRHIKSQHNDQREFVCLSPGCSMRFHRKQTLQRHIERIHANNRIFKELRKM